MQIKKTYISDDGEEFETEEECLEHEKTINSMDSVLMIDSRELVIAEKDPSTAYEKAIYLYIFDTKRARAFLDWIHGETGYSIPEKVKAGELYYYDEPNNEYKELNKKIKELEELRDRLMVMSKTRA